MMKINDEIKKDNPFKVPEGYFDTLTERTMSAIRNSGEEDTVAGNERPVRRISFKPYLALAAAILGFALLATVMVRIVTGGRAASEYEPDNSLYADIVAEELDTYMIELELNQTDPVDITETEQALSSDVIIDYLMNEDIDLNDIYELL